MHRVALLILGVLLVPHTVLSQAAPATDSQTLGSILAELRQIHRDLQNTTAMATRIQIALYRVQRDNEAVAHATQRLSDARSRVANLESAENDKNEEIRQAKTHADHSQDPHEQQALDEVVLPRLNSQLELLQKHERQAQAEQADAEQQLRDEQAKLEALNDVLDRYYVALEEEARKGH
jgi:hypothetical protein